MKRRFCIAITVLTMVLLIASISTAANHKNIIGTWSGWVDYVGWNSTPTPNFYYVSGAFSFEIQSEDLATGNFYGLQADYYPITGNITKDKKVTIIEYGSSPGDVRIITGKVMGKKMTGTMQHFKDGQIDTGTFTFKKQ